MLNTLFTLDQPQLCIDNPQCLGMFVGSASGDEPCTDYDVRLVGGQDMFQGQVEICSKGMWGAVCADLTFPDGSWTRTHAMITCRQLELPTDCETIHSSYPKI